MNRLISEQTQNSSFNGQQIIAVVVGLLSNTIHHVVEVTNCYTFSSTLQVSRLAVLNTLCYVISPF